MSLRAWLWRSYVQAALIPLLLVEVSFLVIYWSSNAAVHRENVNAVNALSRDYLRDVARREATGISVALAGYSRDTMVVARQVARALESTSPAIAAEQARHMRAADGTFYTRPGPGPGGYYSSHYRPDRRRLDHWLKLAQAAPVVMDLQQSDRDMLSIYFNSWDSYNWIYPAIDGLRQYPAGMNIAAYNFYYLADGTHNPARRPVWTEAYIDPAGRGWMVSSIAPVWTRRGLEGVVGIDIGLQAVIGRLMRLQLPWHSYAMLVDAKGTIVALPPAGERDLGLRELTSHRYTAAIRGDSYKPAAFDIARRADTLPLAIAMKQTSEGNATLTIGGRPHLASFASVPGPGWRLVVIAPVAQINAPADALRRRMETVTYYMIAGLVAFYAIFFAVLYIRARSMSARVDRPLEDIAGLMQRIGGGDYRQQFAASGVIELDRVGTALEDMGQHLGAAHDEIHRQEQLVRQALQRQQQVNDAQSRLVQIMSHELRTPLSVIDSAAQIIDRKAEQLQPDDLRQRASRMRRAVMRIAQVIDKLVTGLDQDSGASPAAAPLPPVALAPLLHEVVAKRDCGGRVQIRCDRDISAPVDAIAFSVAVGAAIDNALAYARNVHPVQVSLRYADGKAIVEIADDGPGIPPDELENVGKLFYRGSNAVAHAGAGAAIYVARKLLDGTGTLAVANRNGGTCVTITVPAEAPR